MTSKRKHAAPMVCMRRPATGVSRCQTRKPVSGGSSSATKDTGATSRTVTSVYAFGLRLRCRRAIKEARSRRRTWSDPQWRTEVDRVKLRQDWGISSHGGAWRGRADTDLYGGLTSEEYLADRYGRVYEDDGTSSGGSTWKMVKASMRLAADQERRDHDELESALAHEAAMHEADDDEVIDRQQLLQAHWETMEHETAQEFDHYGYHAEPSKPAPSPRGSMQIFVKTPADS